MKFWYSSTSPFARKVYVTILHHHLEEQVDIQKVQVAFDRNSPHNQDNPLGRIPAFQASSGEWLYCSDLISQYLDELGQEVFLSYPAISSHKAIAPLADNYVIPAKQVLVLK